MISDSKRFNPQGKILVHYDKVKKYFKTGSVDPITIEIDPSNACNHSCPFCISGHIHLSKYKGTKFFDRRIMKKEALMNLVKDITTMEGKFQLEVFISLIEIDFFSPRHSIFFI